MNPFFSIKLPNSLDNTVFSQGLEILFNMAGVYMDENSPDYIQLYINSTHEKKLMVL